MRLPREHLAQFTSVADYFERKAINSNRIMPLRFYQAEVYDSGREEPWFGITE